MTLVSYSVIYQCFEIVPHQCILIYQYLVKINCQLFQGVCQNAFIILKRKLLQTYNMHIQAAPTSNVVSLTLNNLLENAFQLILLNGNVQSSQWLNTWLVGVAEEYR